MESKGRRSLSLIVGPRRGYKSSLFQVPIQAAATAAQAGPEKFVALGTAQRVAKDSLVGSTGLDL